MKYTLVIAFCLLFCMTATSFADDIDSISDTTTSINKTKPNVYINCYYCDYDFLRENVTFVNYMRDRHQADIHILVTSQYTGSGGREYMLEFIGQHDFVGMKDTLTTSSKEADTDDTIRKLLAKKIQLGLIRFTAKTPIADDLSITYSEPEEQEETVDKWNYWFFSISANTWINGEKSYRNLNFWTNLSARRVTEQSRIQFGIWGSYNESKFDYPDYKALSLSRSKGADASFVLSLSDHWSSGCYTEVYSSTFSNRKLQNYNSLSIEFNIFPYDQSSSRQFRFIYRLPIIYANYVEKTIYDKTEEWLFRQTLIIELEMVQPWGDVDVSLSGSHYFHDTNFNRITLSGGFSVRLFEGFSFNIDGRVSRVRDQLSLRKGEASEEEILLRQQELATSYNYHMSFGVSYSFGSIYNNIVNPRFGY